MASIGKGIGMAIYTRTTTGVTNIDFINVAIKLATDRNLCFEFCCEDLKKYLEKLNETLDCYEEITYAFVSDDKVISLYPQKMLKGEKNEKS